MTTQRRTSASDDQRWRNDVGERLGRIEERLTEVGEKFASYPPRTELMYRDEYKTAHVALEARVARLEGSGGRMTPWIAIAVSTITLLFSLGATVTAGVIFLIHNLK